MQGDVFYAPIDPAGRFSVKLPPAIYQLAISAEGFIGAAGTTTGLTRDGRVELPVSRVMPAPDDVVAWLREHGAR